MPGKCKFQDSWLLKGIYKDWLVKDLQDIHFARCRACGKSIKLQTMGEAALTSHAGGAGHKAAVRKLLEGSFMMINSAGQINGTVSRTDENKDQVAICLQRDVLDRITGSDCSDLHHSPTSNSPSHNAELQDVTFPAALFTAPGNLMMINSAGQVNGSVSRTADRKDQVAICLQRDALDRLTGSDCSDLHHSPTSNSPSHNAELQDVTYPAAFFTSPGTSRIIRQRLHPSGSDGEEVGRHSTQHDSIDLTRLEHQQRTEALEQQQQMKILEWENRIKVLAWEQELVREKKRAARQKQKAFRMKKAYYKAKLKRMGEEMPPSSSSSSDEEEKTSDLTE